MANISADSVFWAIQELDSFCMCRGKELDMRAIVQLSVGISNRKSFLWVPPMEEIRGINFFPAFAHPVHGWMLLEVCGNDNLVNRDLSNQLNRNIFKMCAENWV